jgi:hypothetical protein
MIAYSPPSDFRISTPKRGNGHAAAFPPAVSAASMSSIDPALYLDSPDQEGEPGDHAPGCKVVHRGFYARKCCFWSDDIARTNNQRQAERTDNLAEISDPVAEAHAAAPQGRRPHLGRIRPDDRIGKPHDLPIFRRVRL